MQSLWVGNQLSVLEQLSIASFLAYGHPFHLYTYSDIENVPGGTILKDANAIVDEKAVFRHRRGSYAIFADWFRWELLSRHGGYWVDLDVVCLRPFDFADEVVFGKESDQRANVAVLRFPPNHQLAVFMAKMCGDPNQVLPYDDFGQKMKKAARRHLLGNRRDNVGWGETGGPKGFTRALDQFGLFDLGKPIPWFYPVDCGEWRSLFEPLGADQPAWLESSYSVHLWNEMLRRAEFDKNQQFHPESVVERLKARYL